MVGYLETAGLGKLTRNRHGTQNTRLQANRRRKVARTHDYNPCESCLDRSLKSDNSGHSVNISLISRMRPRMADSLRGITPSINPPWLVRYICRRNTGSLLNIPESRIRCTSTALFLTERLVGGYHLRCRSPKHLQCVLPPELV